MTEDKLEQSWEALNRAADRLQADAMAFEAAAKRHHAFIRTMIGQMAFHSLVIFLTGLVTGGSLMKMFMLTP